MSQSVQKKWLKELRGSQPQQMRSTDSRVPMGPKVSLHARCACGLVTLHVCVYWQLSILKERKYKKCRLWFKSRLDLFQKVSGSFIFLCLHDIVLVFWIVHQVSYMLVSLKFNTIVGSASRECSNDATWKNASFIGCSSQDYISLQDDVSIIRGFWELKQWENPSSFLASVTTIKRL